MIYTQTGKILQSQRRWWQDPGYTQKVKALFSQKPVPDSVGGLGRPHHDNGLRLGKSRYIPDIILPGIKPMRTPPALIKETNIKKQQDSDKRIALTAVHGIKKALSLFYLSLK